MEAVQVVVTNGMSVLVMNMRHSEKKCTPSDFTILRTQ